MGYDQERYHTKIFAIDPVEITLTSTGDHVEFQFPYSVAVWRWGVRLSTTLNSTGNVVLALKDSDATERATCSIATGKAAKETELNDDEDYTTPAIFSDGLVTVNVKTAATSAGKGYVVLYVSEDFSGTTGSAA